MLIPKKQPNCTFSWTHIGRISRNLRLDSQLRCVTNLFSSSNNINHRRSKFPSFMPRKSNIFSGYYFQFLPPLLPWDIQKKKKKEKHPKGFSQSAWKKVYSSQNKLWNITVVPYTERIQREVFDGRPCNWNLILSHFSHKQLHSGKKKRCGATGRPAIAVTHVRNEWLSELRLCSSGTYNSNIINKKRTMMMQSQGWLVKAVVWI